MKTGGRGLLHYHTDFLTHLYKQSFTMCVCEDRPRTTKTTRLIFSRCLLLLIRSVRQLPDSGKGTESRLFQGRAKEHALIPYRPAPASALAWLALATPR